MHQVIIDVDIATNGVPAGFHTLDADDPVAMAAMIELAAGRQDKTKAGWMEKTSLPAHADGTTRWDILMLQSQTQAHKDKLAPIVAAVPKPTPQGA